MKPGRPLPPAALALAAIVLGIGLFIAFGLGMGGMGMAHMLAGLIVAVAVGAFALLKGRR